jgi:subtilisin family serine protease
LKRPPPLLLLLLLLLQFHRREALQRGDIVFVASSGNNGTAPTLMDGSLTSMINPGNYPGSYPEVIAVAAVDCSSRLASFSQKNPSVDLAAPGVNILSVASRQYAARAGFMAGGFVSDSPRVFVSPGIASSENFVRWAGIGRVTAKVTDCGTGSAPCPQAKDSICLVQYDPQLKPIPVTTGSNSNSRTAGGSVFSQMAMATYGVTEAAPNMGIQEEPMMPSKFPCDVVDFCRQQGAKAVLLAAPATTTGYYVSHQSGYMLLCC